MSDKVRPLLRWLAAHDMPARVVLVCDHAEVPRVGRDTLVVVLDRCLADAEVGLPAQLLASGVDRVEVAACDPAERAIGNWQRVLPGGVAVADPGRRRGRPGGTVLVLGRIALPRRIVLGLGTRDRPVLDLDQDDPARTLAALRLLADVGRAVPDALAPEGASPEADGVAADLVVQGCVACGVCVRGCPHDALTLQHDGGTSTLVHRAEACRSDLACVRLCPVGAVSSMGLLTVGVVLAQPSRPLAEVETSECARCGTLHPREEGDLCPACAFRARNAFGSAMPPWLATRSVRPEHQAPTTDHG